MDATPEELEAILLRWRMQNPEAPEGAKPSEEESSVLLVEIRERERVIEARVLRALHRATGNPASKGHNSKHLLLFYYFLFGFMVVAFVIAGVTKMIGH